MLEETNEQSNLQYNPADGPILERAVSNYNKDISFRGMI
jgi:hypothetical protein